MNPEQQYDAPKRENGKNPYQAIVDVIDILLRKIAIAPKNKLTENQIKIHVLETTLPQNSLGVEELAQILKTLQQAGAIGRQYMDGGILSATIRMPGVDGIAQSGGLFTIFQPNKELLLKQRKKWLNEGNEPDKSQLQPIGRMDEVFKDTMPIVPMREVLKDAENANRELHRQSFEKQLHRESLKQQRILATQIDKYTHAVNTITEWAEYYGDGKNVSLDYYYFNFEDRMDDSKMLERFLDKLKDAGCFKSWVRTNYSGGTRFGFIEVSLEKLNDYKKKQTGAIETKATPLQRKQDKKAQTKYKNGVLQFQGKEIDFNGKPNQKDLLATLFKEPEKNWFYDEVQGDWDTQKALGLVKYPKNYWRKFYSAGDDINQKVAIETQVKDFVVKDTKQIRINERYV